jgi:MOSC domain-containing protein YiiM
MIPKPGTAFAVPDGDPSRHLSLAELERGLLAMRPAPRDQGTVQHLFARPGSNERVALERATLTVAGGMPGDRWSLGREGKPPKPAQQLATMQVDVARLVANGQPTALFGDNLFLDLDLSSGNLPVGTRLRVGTALLAVTPEEHNGCLKFKARFGADALRLVVRKETRARNLRGIYLEVIEEGEVAAGDPVEVLREDR